VYAEIVMPNNQALEEHKTEYEVFGFQSGQGQVKSSRHTKKFSCSKMGHGEDEYDENK